MYKNNIENYRKSIIKTRRELHQIPEAGFEEYKTQAYLENFLFHLPHVKLFKTAQTGVLAWFDAGHTEAVALRSDIDALSIEEMTQHDFKSSHEGLMHACGHDGHMTMMLHMAVWISEHFDELKKNVMIIFQPAEEGPGGAEFIIKEGVFEKFNIKEIYGYHLYPEVEQGFFATKKGPLMAMTGEFDIVIHGVSGHGAMPHKGIDAAVIASELILQLQNIVSRRISPIEPAVVTVGKVSIGQRRNIIAETAILEGTCRAFSESVFAKIEEHMRAYLRGIEASYGIKTELDFRVMYPPVINDGELVDAFIEANGSDRVQIIEPQMIAEDFALFQKVVPGIFVFVGTKNETKGFVNPLHSSMFDFDESALLDGIEGLLKMLKIRGVL
jgi:amidohydrolase